MSMEKHSEIINSSQRERIIKEDDEENNIVKRVDSSPTVSKTSCDDQTHKRWSDNNENDHDDEDVKLSSPSTSEHNRDSTILKQGEEMESTEAEMGEVMEENQRLKKSLDQIMKDYQALQRKFSVISEQQSKQPVADLEIELSLGRTSSLDSKKRTISTMLEEENNKKNTSVGNEDKDRSLTLTLDSKFEASRSSNSSPGNNSGEAKGGEGVLARKTSDKSNENGEEEMVQQPPVKKARVSVRARCDTPTMNDGCQWRKYGQKIAKGNPCPRAYYRCTVAPSCPVRKQVQRCVEDMSILISTYEGVHNHPLPISATAMASTTSAAAYMLTSGSSTSPNQGSHLPTTTTTAPFGSGIHDNRNIEATSKPQPFYLSTNSSSYSHGPIHPTITLDLTSPTTTSTNQVSKMPLNIASNYSSTHSLDNFNNNSRSLSLSNALNYGDQSYMNKTQVSPLNIVSSKHSTPHHQDQLLNLHTLFQRSNHTSAHSNQDHPLPDTIAQAAKVLTSDPSFQSVLSAALSSFMSGNTDIGKSSSIYDGRVNNTLNSMDFNRNIKGNAVLQTPSSSHSKTLESASKGNHGCTSSLFPSPFIPLPISKSSSSSPSDI